MLPLWLNKPVQILSGPAAHSDIDCEGALQLDHPQQELLEQTISSSTVWETYSWILAN